MNNDAVRHTEQIAAFDVPKPERPFLLGFVVSKVNKHTWDSGTWDNRTRKHRRLTPFAPNGKWSMTAQYETSDFGLWFP